LAAFGPFSSGTTGTSPFSQSSSTLSITDTALSRTFTLNFTWTGSATSAKDEAAIRMGISGGLTGPTTADDYPGVGSRTIGGDGHFVTIGTTIIATPEPESGALVAFGLLGLALRARRKNA
jgi:MYXO-CTERM domain-containing protein